MLRDYLVALLRRWWHCLTHLHQPADLYNEQGDHVAFGCYQCDQLFWRREEPQR